MRIPRTAWLLSVPISVVLVAVVLTTLGATDPTNISVDQRFDDHVEIQSSTGGGDEIVGATHSLAGIMTAADKVRLDNLVVGGGGGSGTTVVNRAIYRVYATSTAAQGTEPLIRSCSAPTLLPPGLLATTTRNAVLSAPAVGDIPSYVAAISGPSSVQITTKTRLSGLRMATIPGLDASLVQYPEGVDLPSGGFNVDANCSSSTQSAWGTTTFGHRQVLFLPSELGLPLNPDPRSYPFQGDCAEASANVGDFCMLGTANVEDLMYDVWVTPGGSDIAMAPRWYRFDEEYVWEFDPVISGQ